MESRLDKYYTENSEQQNTLSPTRSSRNSRLYREVYGKYSNLDNLPLEDNTDEIDMEKLRELVLNTKPKKENQDLEQKLNILEQQKRKIDEQKIYDINKILEKAKYENNKLKEPTAVPSQINKNILSTLESTEISLLDIRSSEEAYEQRKKKTESATSDSLSMTREIKYQNLSQASQENPPEISMVESDLSLDLFSDLKPTGNTIVTKPIVDENISVTSSSLENFHSKDTSDIDIIKPSANESAENDFFTSSYEFSKKDFTSDNDDFYDTNPKGGIFKIILLILAIIVFIGVIVYFIGTYGMGINH